MGKYRQHPMRNTAYQFALLQLIIIASATFCGFLQSSTIALSIFLGGVVWVIPNALFAQFYFARTGLFQLSLILKRFYLGELLKLIAITLSLILIAQCVAVNIPIFMLSFMLSTQFSWLAPVFYNQMTKRRVV
ncbi:MAG: ATP synthase subunit I [Legionellales bacterium]|nr:ATP synthase subunit I [Legionellales bacterium]